MKFKASKLDYSSNSKGEYTITLRVPRSAIIEAEQYVNSDKELSVEIKPYRPKRSLDANAYLWVLIGELSEVLNLPKEDVYRRYIHDCGVYEIVPIKTAHADYWIESWQAKGLGWIAEKLSDSKFAGYTNIVTYYGTSVYNSKEMARLLDEVVAECKTFGIETMPPDELKALEEAYR